MIDRVVPTCPCVRRHSPKPAYLQVHHILPLSWGGLNIPENRVAICGTTHDAVHDLLNKLVRAKGNVPKTGYSAFAQDLAARAVAAYLAAHAIWPHGYTLAHPPAGDI